TLLVLYRVTMLAMSRSKRFASWMEGKPVTIIRDGLYELHSLETHNISSDEFFMELRQQGAEHLGQVRLGILETDGDVSLFFFDPTEVRPGLSVLPAEHRQVYCQVPASGMYACTRCGFLQPPERQQQTQCNRRAGTRRSKALTP